MILCPFTLRKKIFRIRKRDCPTLFPTTLEFAENCRCLCFSDSLAIISQYLVFVDEYLIKLRRPSDNRRPINDQWSAWKCHQNIDRLSVVHRVTIVRLFTDDETPKNRRIGQRNLFTLVLRKESSVYQNTIGQIVSQQLADSHPIIIYFTHQPSAVLRLGNMHVTVTFNILYHLLDGYF